MKKIMFNDRYGLTQAVIEGRKTMTRRIIPKEFFTLTWDEREDTLVYENASGDFIDIRRSRFARYKVGEVVAVAQSYQDIFDYSNCINPYAWEDDDKPSGWTNKMLTKAELMPHRIRITGVRAERLQDISDEDCMREGVQYIEDIGKYYFERKDRNEGFYFKSPRKAFASLIDKVCGKGTWDSDPWVFVYEFELVK